MVAFGSIAGAQTHTISIYEFSATTNTSLLGISGDGTIAGDATGPSTSFSGLAFRALPGQNPVLIQPSGGQTNAADMTESGLLFGRESTGTGALPFTYSLANSTNFLAAPADDFDLIAMNGNGHYIGREWNPDTFSYEPFVLDGNGKNPLPTNLRPEGYANDGTIVGWDSDTFRGFIRSPDGGLTSTWLDSVGGISDDGTVWAGASGSSLVVYIDGVEYSSQILSTDLPTDPLSLSGTPLGSLATYNIIVGDVNSSGQVVGTISALYNATGGGFVPRSFGFVANPVPEPGTMAVLGGALALFARRRRKG